MAVFVGGCDGEAAAAVTGLAPGAVLDGLRVLVEQNLFLTDSDSSGADGDTPLRFLMLETIREFGLAMLTEGETLEETRRAHATWCLALAEQAEPELRTAGPSPRRVRPSRSSAPPHDGRPAHPALVPPDRGYRARPVSPIRIPIPIAAVGA